MYRKKHTYRVECSLKFQTSTEGLGAYIYCFLAFKNTDEQLPKLLFMLFLILNKWYYGVDSLLQLDCILV